MWSQIVNGTGNGAADAMRELGALPWVAVGLIGLGFIAATYWLARRRRGER
jgi:hypothetical protein